MPTGQRTRFHVGFYVCAGSVAAPILWMIWIASEWRMLVSLGFLAAGLGMALLLMNFLKSPLLSVEAEGLRLTSRRRIQFLPWNEVVRLDYPRSQRHVDIVGRQATIPVPLTSPQLLDILGSLPQSISQSREPSPQLPLHLKELDLRGIRLGVSSLITLLVLLQFSKSVALLALLPLAAIAAFAWRFLAPATVEFGREAIRWQKGMRSKRFPTTDLIGVQFLTLRAPQTIKLSFPSEQFTMQIAPKTSLIPLAQLLDREYGVDIRRSLASGKGDEFRAKQQANTMNSVYWVCAIFTCLTCFPIAHEIREYKDVTNAIATWPRVTGNVAEASEVKEGKYASLKVAVRYLYRGREYLSSATLPGTFQRWKSRYAPQQQVEVWLDPEHPSNIRLELRSVDTTQTYDDGVALVVMILGVQGCIIFGLHLQTGSCTAKERSPGRSAIQWNR